MASYVQASSNAPPSASQLAAASTGSRMDTGASTAAELDATRMAYQQAYSDPVVFRPETSITGGPPNQNGLGGPWTAQHEVPAGYNTSGPYPAKYSLPTPAKERIVARNALRRQAPMPNAGGAGTVMVDTVTEDEVDYLQGMNRQAELADYDRYVSTLVDPRQPGQLRWLYEVYPDFVHRRIAQVQQDFDFAIKNKLIDMWGINSKEDLDFKYLVDQGKIDGPRLYRPPPPYDDMYRAGWLSPWHYMRGRERGVNMPFTSAQDGPRPPGTNMWTMSDMDGIGRRQPLSHGRGWEQMAHAYWQRDGAGGRSDAAARADAPGTGPGNDPYGGVRPLQPGFQGGAGRTPFVPAVA